MWFKNLKVYTLTQSLKLSAEELEDQLAQSSFRPCGNQDTASMGWTSPFKQGVSLVHAGDGKLLISLKKQERILPASVVNAELDERVEKIEQETGSPVGKKAKQDLKQEIVHQLLPKSFTRDSYTMGFISLKDSLVVIDAANDGKAEAFLAHLRKSIGSLPVVPLARRSISADMTDWLKNDNLPADMELLEEAEFKSPDESGAIIKCKHQALDAEEIQLHLSSGKLVQKLAIEWDDTLTTLLQEDLSIKRLKFSDVVREQNEDIPKDQQLARLDADFCLMSAEAIRFIKALDQALNLSEQN
ncbi:recombination-associated protein RdgC [Lacimicrobium alkaliphilum]|uniref:Recombination-associated protein RdgC n=1 Tax=Lacimicrobium alkaliphilum TaxID=1526571 RepID=A0ABQ1RBU9_9ALTE|nr:recombination-associated protein RdgC [Lacimicrobium alkaliphilum]GGD65181.1 recombination-associated protein RdgC [Lacimicrobium alkaliphilum]